MQLFYSPASPFVRKVRAVAEEAGLASRIELVRVKTSPVATAPEIIPANPVGKIPTLVRDDGPAIFDSRVICRYLDHLAGAGLYPEVRLWEVLTLEALADALMDAAVLLTYEARYREAGLQHEGWMEGQRQKIRRAVAALEDTWMSHLAGRVTAAQIGVASALGYLDFRQPDLDWRAERPELAAWYARFAERPSMVATRPQD